MARILFVGCGYVGTVLGLRLTSEGHEVFGLRRNPAGLPAPIRALAADVTDTESLNDLPDSLDYVFYATTPSGYSDAAYRATYVEGARNMLAALDTAHQSVKRFFFISSTGVYGQQDGSWVDETSPTAPSDFSGQRLLEAEHVVLDGPFPRTVVRFGGIYGPGRRRLIDNVLKARPCAAGPPLYTNRIHRDDCASVLLHLMSLEEPEPLYLGVDNEPAEQCVVMDWLAHRLEVSLPPRIAAGSGADSSRRANKRCSNAQLLASGYRFRYPTFREGYTQVLKELP